ncbi:tetratricopeptide repeat protein [Bdellovibrio sp. HCB185ZH]|uniref:tetratricopeptide repeat protein n=1 Tax=Bdellovibrio sp. HCB185ZH TaxID=3394235 RepID=UPI0039A4E549
MKNKKTAIILFVILIVVIVLAVIFFPKKTGTEAGEPGSTVDSTQPPVIPENRITRIQLPSGTDQVIYHDTAKPEASVITLNVGNFESFVLKCFQGENCVLGDDPMKMYQDFKAAGNNRAVDSLISFLRSKLRKPEFKDQYKDIVKKMIEDFYPPEEKQFQEAAYYNYLGDLNKSLELYLDLKEKAKTNPKLHDVSNLNIANTYYDLKRYSDAQPYYEAALLDYTSGKIKSAPDPTSFVEERIAEIKARLYHTQ